MKSLPYPSNSAHSVLVKLLRRSPQSSRTSTPASSPTASQSPDRTKRRRSRGHTSQETLIFCFACTLFFGAIISTFSILVAPRQPSVKPSLVTDDLNSFSLLLSTWSQSDLVHVIQTRFMQHQPQLVDLGLARLKIFEYFCLPSIVKQTSQEFIWIIRTDPDLDQRVKEPLLDLLKGHPNYLLVASNENPEGFRHALAIEDITIDSLWSGDLHLLQQLHDAAQSRIVLETRLDGDDGLHTSFVEYIQAKAIEHIIDPFSWTIWCLFNHMEWQYSSPFQSTADVSAGFWVGVRSACCVTPGLTMVYGKEVNRDDLPRGTHQNLHKVLATCNNDVDDHCLRRFRELMPGAIRARTPTSAGMANVIIGNHGKRDVYKKAEFQANVQNEIWKGVEEVFFVSMEKAKGVRNYIRHNLKLIAADNLKGQCTKGHSCKSTSKDILKGLMADVLLARE